MCVCLTTPLGIFSKSCYRHCCVFAAVVVFVILFEKLCINVMLFAEYKTRIYAAIIEMLRWFAGKQVRNTGVSIYKNTVDHVTNPSPIKLLFT